MSVQINKKNNVRVLEISFSYIMCHTNLTKKLLVMGELSSFPHKSNNVCSKEEEKDEEEEEEEEEYIYVLGIPYLQMLQRGR